jgi:hypothetical protein
VVTSSARHGAGVCHCLVAHRVPKRPFRDDLQNWNDDFWSLDRTGTDGWLIYDTAGTTAGLVNLSVAGSPWLDSLGNSLASIRPNASFGFEQVGDDVYLTFAAVPEPSSIVLMGLGSVIACLALRRRKRPGAARVRGLHRVLPRRSFARGAWNRGSRVRSAAGLH